MGNYETVWEISRLYIPGTVILLIIMSLGITIFCVLIPIIEYIFNPEERNSENIASIIRWCIPALILICLCCADIYDYRNLNIVGKYYGGMCDVVEGEVLEQIASAHYTIVVDDKELHLTDGFAIEKILPREGDYVRVHYVVGSDNTLIIAKIEKLKQ